MDRLLCLKLAGIRDKFVDQMAVCYWPCYITHLELMQALAEPEAQGLSIVHWVMLSCGSLFTARSHPPSVPMRWGWWW